MEQPAAPRCGERQVSRNFLEFVANICPEGLAFDAFGLRKVCVPTPHRGDLPRSPFGQAPLGLLPGHGTWRMPCLQGDLNETTFNKMEELVFQFQKMFNYKCFKKMH